jgi:hypothetical protein
LLLGEVLLLAKTAQPFGQPHSRNARMISIGSHLISIRGACGLRDQWEFLNSSGIFGCTTTS